MSIENIQEIKKIIRSLLISAKNGLSSLQLERDFISQIGKPIPFKSYGHISLESLLCSMPDVVQVSKRKGMLHLRGVATNETSHIARMVQLQTGGHSNIMPITDNSRHRHKLFYANTVHRPEQPPSIPDYVCVQVRAVLISYPNGVELASFPTAYKNRFGYCLQTSKFGFSSLRNFFSNIHGVTFFTRNGLEYIEYSSDVIPKKSPPSDRSPPGFSRNDSNHSMPSFCEVARKKITKPTFQAPPETSTNCKPIITELNLSENPLPEDGEILEQTAKLTIKASAQEGDVSKTNQASPPSTPGTSVSRFIPPPPLNQPRIRKPLNQAAQLAIYKQKHGQNMSSKLSKEVSDLLDTLPPSIPMDELVEAYKMRYGFDFPFKEFGFSSSQDLIQSLWQTCKLDKREIGMFVTALDGSHTSSTQTFVQEEQASRKSKIIIDLEIVNRVRSLLLKWPSGMPISLLQEKYLDVHHEELPYLELGFDDIYEMMISIPDCVSLIPNKIIDPSRTDYVLHGIPIFDEECLNIMLPSPEKYTPSNNIVLPFAKQSIPANWEFNVYIPFISNPDRFWVQKAGLTYEVLGDLLEDMTRFYNKLNPEETRDYLLNNPGEGQNCAAPYQKDGYYYRAKIMKIPLPDQAEVFYVDYGNKSRVPLGSLRRIKALHMVVPSQAIQCRLANVKPFDGIRWASGSALKMKDFTNNLELRCKIQNIEPDDTLSVHLTDPKSESDQSINQALIACGIASHEENNIPLHPTRACMSPEETQLVFSYNPPSLPPSLPPHISNLTYPIPQPVQYSQPPVLIPYQNNVPYYNMPQQYNTHSNGPQINPIPYPYAPPHQTYPPPYIPQQPIHPGYLPPPPVQQPAHQQIPTRPTSNFRVGYRFPLPSTTPAIVSSQEDAYVYNDRDNQILEKMLKEKEHKVCEEEFNPPPSMGTFEKVQKFLSTSSNPDQLQQQKKADKLRVLQLMQERGTLVDKGVDTSNKTAFDLYLADLNKMSSEIEEISTRFSEALSPTSPTSLSPLFPPPIPSLSPPHPNPALIPSAPILGRGRLGPAESNRPRVQFKYKGIGRGGKMSDLI